MAVVQIDWGIQRRGCPEWTDGAHCWLELWEWHWFRRLRWRQCVSCGDTEGTVGRQVALALPCNSLQIYHLLRGHTPVQSPSVLMQFPTIDASRIEGRQMKYVRAVREAYEATKELETAP